jgi:Secretion system C-terminal sorting domain
MKTFLQSSAAAFRNVFFLAVILFTTLLKAQTVSSSDGFNFDNPQLLTANDLEIGAEYLFSNVGNNIDAKIRIDSLVNGATISKIDDNSNGTGFKSAFQPAVKSGGIIGSSYAVFTISFYQHGTSTSVSLPLVNVTPIDIDGSNSLREFAEVRAGAGATANYLTVSPDISVQSMAGSAFMGKNVMGIERNGIDTAAMANMFTVTNANISSFSVKYGTETSNASSGARQFSLYFKSFSYIPSVLPVKLISFTASLYNNKAELNWKTATEENVNYFVVEKSFDGINFNDAGMAFAIGNTSSENKYSMNDNLVNVTSPVVYYRLRSVDNDGKTQLSETRMLKLSKQNSNNISILTYPNPVSSELRITIPAVWQNKPVTYEIVSLTGQVVSKSARAAAGQTETTNISNLQAGFYMVKVTCDGQVATQKIVKQ